jgi:predicted transcriptional regulator
MAGKNIGNPKPSELELQVLSVLWDNGPCTVRAVMELLPDGKERAYTSVLSVMQVMEKKGLLTHTSKGNSYIYKPCRSRRAVLAPYMKQLVSNVFGGSRVNMVQSLLGSGKLSDEEICELEKLLGRKKK